MIITANKTHNLKTRSTLGETAPLIQKGEGVFSQIRYLFPAFLAGMASVIWPPAIQDFYQK
ncbi:hypothetical protein EBZ39_07440 [bacterium]|nr:hypothetical protein [bacterium]